MDVRIAYFEENFLRHEAGVSYVEVFVWCPSANSASKKIIVGFKIEIRSYFFKESVFAASILTCVLLNVKPSGWSVTLKVIVTPDSERCALPSAGFLYK